LELLKSCSNVSELARELGIRRKWLYKWRNQARAKAARTDGDTKFPAPVEAVREPDNGALRQRLADLERLVGRQTAEVDFFRNALRRVEDRRQRKGEAGGEASTSKSRS
jgi:transposase-like protein